MINGNQQISVDRWDLTFSPGRMRAEWACMEGLCSVGCLLSNKTSPFFIWRLTFKQKKTDEFSESLAGGTRVCVLSIWLTIFIGIFCGPGEGVRSCLATASLCAGLEADKMVLLPSSFITMEAPGWTLGPLRTAWRSSFTFHGVTGWGYVSFVANTFTKNTESLFNSGSNSGIWWAI